MAKYDVTSELASVIKSTRIANNVTAKSIAEHVGKSQSYISKLEKGDIKSIEQSELISIFRFILGSEEAFQDFLNKSLSKIISSVALRYNDDEINEQFWYLNFDQVLRLIPIPEKMIDDLSEKIKDNNISIEYLCERINGNESISPEVADLDSYPYNTWFPLVEDGEIKSRSIKMKVSKSEIYDILNKDKLNTNYVTMLSIVYYIIIIIKYGHSTEISKEKYKEIMTYSIEYLNGHHFFSLEEKHYLEMSAKSEKDRNALLSEFDKDNAQTINMIINTFRVFSDIDILKTTEYLNQFKNNLDWDSGFMLRLISFNFYEIINIETEQKQQLLYEIKKLIEKYKDIPDTENQIKIYD